jgi:putative redox protein
MDARITWEKDLEFVGVADSGFPIRMSSSAGPHSGVGPVELTLMALAACTAMDVISILRKKRERVIQFEIQAHADRTQSYPKVITRATLQYVVVGTDVQESSLLRAIELSVKQYCPVHAMLSKAFPVDLSYSIFEAESGGERKLVRQGTFHGFQEELGSGPD